MNSSLSTEECSNLESQKRRMWDSFLEANSCGNLWQTIDYGEYTRKLKPFTRAIRLIAERDGVPESIVQGICTPWVRAARFSKFLGFGTVLTIREGPVLNMKSRDRIGLMKYVIPALENFGIKNRFMEIRIVWPYKWGNADLFMNMGYQNVGTDTQYIIDLSRGTENLWRHITGNKRRNIKKALDRGVEFVESSSFADIEKFYELTLEVAKRHKSPPAEPLSEFQTIWNLRSQKGSSKVFFARWNGNNVSGVFATTHAKTIYAIGFGYKCEALEVRPNDFLHWKIMEWGCKQGFLKYHMGDIFQEKALSSGLWRWKREWNGDIDDAYIFRKEISKHGLFKHVYNTIQKLG